MYAGLVCGPVAFGALLAATDFRTGFLVFAGCAAAAAASLAAARPARRFD